MSIEEDVFITKQEYCTSVYWTAVFGNYDCTGWLLKEIKSSSPLDVTKFRAMSKDIEKLLIDLNKKSGRPKKGKKK